MRSLTEHLRRLGERAGRQVFEKQRQEIRQLGGTDGEAVLFVERLQIDHRLAAVAAFAVNVLEQMKRQGAGTIEQEDVALL